MATRINTWKWISVATGCIMVLSEGIVLSFSSWQNKLKDTFNMSQTQVEIIGSVQNLGMEATLIGGITLEKHGGICTGVVALVSGGMAFMLNMVIASFPNNFNWTIFVLMSILYLFIGIGIGTNYMWALTISLRNVSCASGGKLIAVMAVFMFGFSSLVSWFSSRNSDHFIYYMVGFAVVHILTSLLGLVFLREVVPVSKETDSTDGDGNQTETAPTEGTALTPTVSNSLNSSSYYGDKHGFEILRITDFWLLASTLIISVSVDKMFFMNIGTYLRSFRQEGWLQVVTTVGPLVALGTKLILGPVSDACRLRITRIWFFIVPVSLKMAMFIVFFFTGDNVGVFFVTACLSYTSFAAVYLLVPVLFGEYFGMKYYGRNYGSAVFASGLLTVMFQVLLGILYDWKISYSKDEATCFGLKCFHGANVILIVLTFITVCTSLTLWKRKPKS